MEAADNGHGEVVSSLLHAGANVNIKNHWVNTHACFNTLTCLFLYRTVLR